MSETPLETPIPLPIISEIQQTEVDQETKNREILRQTEMGAVLEQLYDEALKADPRLADVEFVTLDDDTEPSVAFALPSWETKGKHQVHVRVGNLDEVLRKVQANMDQIPGSRELFAGLIGVKPEDMTPQLLQAFALLHELGHVTEYMDYEDDPEKLIERRKREYLALPIGNATVSSIARVGSANHRFVTENWEGISADYGVSSLGELLERQHAEFRGMTNERRADGFAASVLHMSPDIVAKLSGPSVEEPSAFAIAA